MMSVHSSNQTLTSAVATAESMTLIFFDLETTGLPPPTPKGLSQCRRERLAAASAGVGIVEFAASAYELDSTSGHWVPVTTGPPPLILQVCPILPIHPEAAKIHGHTEESLRDAPTFIESGAETVAQWFNATAKAAREAGRCGSIVAIAHNAHGFDAPVWIGEASRAAKSSADFQSRVWPTYGLSAFADTVGRTGALAALGGTAGLDGRWTLSSLFASAAAASAASDSSTAANIAATTRAHSAGGDTDRLAFVFNNAWCRASPSARRAWVQTASSPPRSQGISRHSHWVTSASTAVSDTLHSLARHGSRFG